MSGIAEVLINQNYEVSGSDYSKSSITDHLESFGAKIHFDHKPENINNKHVVVVSSAIQDDNPEVMAITSGLSSWLSLIHISEPTRPY